MTHIAPALAATFPPPVMEARRWLAETTLPEGLPLLNLSQAAPVAPPPEPLRAEMGRIVAEDAGAHLYGPVLGLPELREQVAADWSRVYGGAIDTGDVAITAGCNQAFCTVMQSLAAPGDNVILPLPWYFNHKMWLDMTGVETRLLAPGEGLVPDPAAAEALIDARTRAIILVTPNNPTGAEYPAGVLEAFRDVARRHGIALIVDETYRDFHSAEGAPHMLFADPDWRDVLIHLYSFSKAFRLTGHRVGAIIAAPERLAQMEKILDTVTICAPQIGQRAALYGLRKLGAWVRGERAEILRRRDAVRAAFQRLSGWELLGSGAYFAFVRHPFEQASDEIARRLLAEQAILALPGTMFGPVRGVGGDGSAEACLRIAFANADEAGLETLGNRLSAFG